MRRAIRRARPGTLIADHGAGGRQSRRGDQRPGAGRLHPRWLEGSQVIIVNRWGTLFTASYAVAAAGALARWRCRPGGARDPAIQRSRQRQSGARRRPVRPQADQRQRRWRTSATWPSPATPCKRSPPPGALVNSSADPDAAPYTAAAADATLFVVKREGCRLHRAAVGRQNSAGVTAVTVAAIGGIDAATSTAVADETWTLRVTDGQTVTDYSAAVAGGRGQCGAPGLVLQNTATQVNAASDGSLVAAVSNGRLQLFRLGTSAVTAHLASRPRSGERGCGDGFQRGIRVHRQRGERREGELTRTAASTAPPWLARWTPSRSTLPRRSTPMRLRSRFHGGRRWRQPGAGQP